MNTQKHPKLKNYDLGVPNKQTAITALSLALGREEAQSLWSRVCRQYKIHEDTERLGDLSTIFLSISLKRGPEGVVGKSLLVRMNTYQLLLKHIRESEIRDTEPV